MRPSLAGFGTLTVFALVGVGPSMLHAQPAPTPYDVQTLSLTISAGTGTKAEGVRTQVVAIPGATWLRLQFSAYNLGPGDFLTITSLLDGGMQYHDARTLPDWGDATAYFNGEAVEVTLHSGPGEAGAFVTVGEVRSGRPLLPTESQCGDTDDRVPSNDPAIGRMIFDFNASSVADCTAWITSNASNLTAGHCLLNPIVGPPIVLEFNYPDSLDDGTPVFAGPDDQYPVDQTTITAAFNAVGDDWGLFECNANSNTGLRPVQAQGAFYRMSRDTTQAAAPIVRITGNGIDSTPSTRNQTQQTHAGSNLGETVAGFGTRVFWEYLVDTRTGNSGSPIIVEGSDVTLGIHTNGGCSPPSTGNAGTSFENDALENAIQVFPAPVVQYVDVGHPFAASLGDGTVFRPYGTVTEAVDAVASGGIISIVAGSYTAAAGNAFTAGADGKAITFQAPVGPATIGD